MIQALLPRKGALHIAKVLSADKIFRSQVPAGLETLQAVLCTVETGPLYYDVSSV